MITSVLFDADGMIVHGERFSDRLAREHGISTDTTAPFFRNEFQLCVIGKADLKQELAKHLETWGWTSGVEALLSDWFAADLNRIDGHFPPVIDKLRAKGIKTYLVTNNEKYRLRNLLAQRGLTEWFDGVFASCEIGFKKPEPPFFQHIADTLDSNKEDIQFWDDDVQNVAAAMTFGFSAELYKNFRDFETKIKALLS